MERAEANIRAFLLEMGRVGGGVERDDAEVVWTVGGSPIGYHNAVVDCAVPPARADELIETWAAELDRRGLPGSWHVSPSMRPADLADRLLAHGFEDGGEEPAMAADLTAPAAAPPVRGLTIERVRTEADLDAYRDVLAGGFGEGPPEATWVAEVFGRIGLGSGGPWTHLLGRLEGVPVATATLFVHPREVAGISFVCTDPALRGRGIGAAVTAAAMQEAVRSGCTTAVLGSSPMGYGVYRRLGFEELFRYRLLEWTPAPPSSGACHRTTSSSNPVSTS